MAKNMLDQMSYSLQKYLQNQLGFIQTVWESWSSHFYTMQLKYGCSFMLDTFKQNHFGWNQHSRDPDPLPWRDGEAQGLQ